MMLGLKKSLVLTTVLLTAACGGSKAPAEEPDSNLDDPFGGDSYKEYESDSEPDSYSSGMTEDLDGNPRPSKSNADPKPEPEQQPSSSVPTPEFKPGMSVSEAIDAVPQGIERVNIETERLGEPLQDSKIYEPCKLSRAQHFQMKVAVWDGRAVGIDIKTTPKNDEVAACIRQQVSQVVWPDKVPSLNTIEFGF